MPNNPPTLRWMRLFALTAAIAGTAVAQGTGAVATAQAAGGVDLTGYWVSVIVDDLRFYLSPQKGDIAYLPLNAEARRVANLWDPDKDIADGNQCRAYGAVGLMQQPGRLHITWADANTLRIDADAGTQTRLLHFGSKPEAAGKPSLQGYSIARWDSDRMARGAMAVTQGKSLTVVTTDLLSGYLRKNGVPYSGKAVLTEYWNVLKVSAGQVYLSLTAVVDDPTYLTEPFFKTYTFKNIPDSSGWDPTPCWPK